MSGRTLSRDREIYNARHSIWEKKYRRRFPNKALWRSCKKRANRLGLEFDIVVNDIIIPEKCPILGIDIRYAEGPRGNWPSIDRVDNSKGYTKGNICVISIKANAIKSDLTLEQARALVALMEKHHE